MGTISVFQSVTLDGVMQDLGRADEDTRDGFTHGGWGDGYSDEVAMQFVGEGMATASPCCSCARTPRSTRGSARRSCCRRSSASRPPRSRRPTPYPPRPWPSGWSGRSAGSRTRGSPFVVPDRAVMPERLPAVLEAVYGCTAIAAQDVARVPADASPAHEAQYLAVTLAALLDDEPEAWALAALETLLFARRSAADPDRFVPLDEQDPARWDTELLAEGEAYLRRASRGGGVGRFRLEAATRTAHAPERPTGGGAADAVRRAARRRADTRRPGSACGRHRPARRAGRQSGRSSRRSRGLVSAQDTTSMLRKHLIVQPAVSARRRPSGGRIPPRSCRM